MKSVSPENVLSHKAPLPVWLSCYFLLLPFGIPIFEYLVPSDFCLLYGIVLSIISAIRNVSYRLPTPNSLGLKSAALIAFVGFSIIGKAVPLHLDFVVFNLISVLWAASGSIIIVSTIKSREALDCAVERLNTLFVPLLIFCITGMLLHHLGFDEWTFEVFAFRLYFPFRFPILLGAYLIAAYPFAVIWKQHSFAKRMIYNLSYLLVISGVGSRSCMLTAILQVLWEELMQDSKKSGLMNLSIKLLGLASIVVFSVGIGFMLSEEIAFRRAFAIAGVQGFFQDEPRQRQIANAILHASDWFTGLGLGCFQGIYHEELHNTPLNLLFETGIGGFSTAHLLFAAALLPAAMLLFKDGGSDKRRAAALIASAVGLYILGLFHNLLRNRFIWIVSALAVTLTSSGRVTHFPIAMKNSKAPIPTKK